MGTVYVFFADGFEEIEAFTSVDVMRRAGLNVEMVTVTPDEIVTGAHDVPVLCDKNVVNCDFFDAELVLLPGGMPGASTLEKCGELRNLVLRFAQEQKPIAAICAAPMVLGKLGLLNEVTQVISRQLNVNIRKLTIETNDGIFEGKIQLYVHDVDDVRTICNNLKQIQNIKQVTRVEE